MTDVVKANAEALVPKFKLERVLNQGTVIDQVKQAQALTVDRSGWAQNGHVRIDRREARSSHP